MIDSLVVLLKVSGLLFLSLLFFALSLFILYSIFDNVRSLFPKRKQYKILVSNGTKNITVLNDVHSFIINLYGDIDFKFDHESLTYIYTVNKNLEKEIREFLLKNLYLTIVVIVV